MNILNNLSIRSKMVIPVLFGMGILTGGLVYYFTSEMEKNIHDELSSIAERTVSILSHALEYSVSTNEINDVEYLIEWLLQQSDVHSIEIASNGEVLLKRRSKNEFSSEYLHTFIKDITHELTRMLLTMVRIFL